MLLSDQAATKGLITTISDFTPRIKGIPFINPHIPHRFLVVNG